jgi:FtsH-binding integral membrane protein
VGHIFLAIVLGLVGVFFLASGFQAYPNDFRWFGWIAIGTGLTAGAIFVFVARKPERDEHRP